MDDANPVISLLLREFKRQASAKTEETNLQVTFPSTFSSGLKPCKNVYKCPAGASCSYPLSWSKSLGSNHITMYPMTLI